MKNAKKPFPSSFQQPKLPMVCAEISVQKDFASCNTITGPQRLKNSISGVKIMIVLDKNYESIGDNLNL